MKRLRFVALSVASCAFASALAPSLARAQACYGNLTWQKVYTPFAQNPIPGTDFASASAVSVDAQGNLVVAAGAQPLNTEQIILPYDQDVQVKFVYEQGNNSGTLGWFYWDQITGNANFWDPVGLKLIDKDVDGIPDVFQWKTATRLADGLFARTSALQTIPDLLTSSTVPPYSDAGTYPHIPNVMEPWIASAGGIVFKLADDDNDVLTANGYATTLLPLVADGKTDVAGGDGIPDYDVNGDAIIGNAADRTVDLGVLRGNREIVLWYLSYGGNAAVAGSGWTVANSAVGLTGTVTQVTRTMPVFSKTILNADAYGTGYSSGNTVAAFDAGCTYGTSCNGKAGWIDAAALARLNTANYNTLSIPSPTARSVLALSTNNGVLPPHFLAVAPSGDANRWLFGIEDAPFAKASNCVGCTVNDKDYNDAVFLIQHLPGGTATSTMVATDIQAAADFTNAMVTKIQVQASALFPGTCPQPSSATPLNAGSTRIDVQYSVDNGTTWYPVVFPPSASGLAGTTSIDVLSAGVSGSQLLWRAVFSSGVDLCTPKLAGLSIGYQAAKHGTFQVTEPIPVANVLFRGQYETPGSTWTGADRSVRGHLTVNQLYNLDSIPQIDYTDPTAMPPNPAPPLKWDAGVQLNLKTPDTRTFFYNAGTVGALSSFTTGASALDQLVLPGTGICKPVGGTGTGARCNTGTSGSYLYDFNGDGQVDDTDGDWVIAWTRGWSGWVSGARVLPQRPWMLGAILRSTPAMVTEPGDPWWFDDTRDVSPLVTDSAALRNLYANFKTAQAGRRALALVGAQDGVLHAFDAGLFKWGDDPITTNIIETHGYFAHNPAVIGDTNRDYGDGSELWAFVPPGQIDQVKNNTPKVAGQVAGLSRASMDASVSVTDACLAPPAAPVNGAPPPNCSFITVAVTGETRTHPFITALDVTNANTKTGGAPRAIWPKDWPSNDSPAVLAVDEMPQGSEFGPALGPVLTTAGRTFMAIHHTGIAATALTKLMMYFIDLSTGKTANKVQLNISQNGIDCSVATTGGVLGAYGSPVAVDSDHDGLVDRVYLTDTNGCVYKVNTKPKAGGAPSVCVLFALGEPVFAPMAVRVSADVNQHVNLFIGGGDNPDSFDITNLTTVIPAGGYHLFALEDDDLAGDCHVASTNFVVPLRPLGDPGTVHKLWSAPAVTNDQVYVTTSVGDEIDPCNTDPNKNGVLEGWLLTPDQNHQAIAFMSPVALASGSGSGGVRVYDGHLFTNSLNGTTTVIGKPRSFSVGGTVGARPGFGNPVWIER